MNIRYRLFDSQGELVEEGSLPVEEAADKAAEFVRLHGGDPDEDGEAAMAGAIEFEPDK